MPTFPILPINQQKDLEFFVNLFGDYESHDIFASLDFLRENIFREFVSEALRLEQLLFSARGDAWRVDGFFQALSLFRRRLERERAGDDSRAEDPTDDLIWAAPPTEHAGRQSRLICFPR